MLEPQLLRMAINTYPVLPSEVEKCYHQSCPTLCEPTDQPAGFLCPWNSPGEDTEWDIPLQGSSWLQTSNLSPALQAEPLPSECRSGELRRWGSRGQSREGVLPPAPKKRTLFSWQFCTVSMMNSSAIIWFEKRLRMVGASFMAQMVKNQPAVRET